MTDEPIGPWLLALGALLVAVVAVTVELLRRMRDRATARRLDRRTP